MKRILLISAILTLAFSVGCRKTDGTASRSTGDVELSFALSTAQPVQEGSDKTAKATKATPEYLAEGSTFSVVVFKAGDPLATATPVARGSYRATNSIGESTPITEFDRINLFRGTFDIYIYSPASDDYKAIKVGDATDFAVKTLMGTVVAPQADGRYLVSAELERLSSKLDVKIVAGEFYKTLAIGSKDFIFTGIPSSADYAFGGSGYTNIGAATASANIKATEFANIDPLTISTEAGLGAVAISGTYAPEVSMEVYLDGVLRTMVAKLPAGTVFETGKKHLVTIKINNKGLVDAVNVEVKPWGDGDSESVDVDFGSPVINYSATPSNCYVTYPKNGTYQPVKFNALKRPVAKYVSGSSTVANAKGSNPASATDATLGNDIVFQSGDQLEVVWQTAVGHATGGSMVIKSANLASDGTATVEVNGAGNAVLAYKRGSTILWNYHIWATDSNPFVTHATANSGGNVNGMVAGSTQAKFMDRNLGALSATATKPAAADAPKYFGLFYQYGRPTPFTGQGASATPDAYPQIYNQNGSAITMNNIGGFTVQAEVAVSNVTTAVQNPMNWYYKNIGGGNTWYSFGEVSLWSDYGVNKSIYDPCPYGYRVPKLGSWTGFTAPPFSTAINAGTMAFDTWWPATGWRQGDYSLILRDVGAEGRYWSSSLYASNRSFYLYFSTTQQDGATYYSRSSGFAVRCVQEGY